MAIILDDLPSELLSMLLAAALACASLPVIVVTVPSGNSVPAYTLDICHPLPSLDRSSAPAMVALPVTTRPLATLPETAGEPAAIVPHPTRAGEAPDPPPPKAVV